MMVWSALLVVAVAWRRGLPFAGFGVFLAVVAAILFVFRWRALAGLVGALIRGFRHGFLSGNRMRTLYRRTRNAGGVKTITMPSSSVAEQSIRRQETACISCGLPQTSAGTVEEELEGPAKFVEELDD